MSAAVVTKKCPQMNTKYILYMQIKKGSYQVMHLPSGQHLTPNSA